MTATKSEPPVTGTVSSGGLKRQIGIIGLTWASVGSIIGSGWLFGAKDALVIAGPAAIISWVIGGVAILILALIHAELGGMYPVAGGSARFPHYAFGGVAGASFGWFSWLQAATVAPIEVEAMITYAQHYPAFDFMQVAKTGILTPAGIVVAVLLMAVLTAINLTSIKVLATTNSAATWWKVGIPLLTIFVLAIVSFNTSNFSAANGFAPAGAKGILSAVASGGIIFSLLGFEQADQLAGESKNPKKDVPRAVIFSVLIGVIIYVALQVVFLTALPHNQVVGTWAKATYTTMTGPFADVATLVGVGWLGVVLYIDAVISPGGTGLIYTTASSRVSYGLSRNGYFPKLFEKTNRAGVPWFGLIIAFVIGCVCFLPFPSWQSLVGLITSASVLMYAGAPLAFGVFRKRIPEVERPWKLPGGKVFAPIAFIVANYIILWTGWDTDWKLGFAILLGYLIIVLNWLLRLNPVKPHWNWYSAMWLPVYLVGSGVIVGLSTFGGSNVLPLGIDMIVSGIFSLIIYYWALAVSQTREQILEIVEDYTPEEEGLISIK